MEQGKSPEKHWHQHVAVGYTDIGATVLFVLGVGVIVAILFAPGYVLVAAVLPRSPLRRVITT